MKLLTFISTYEHFRDEDSGIKPYTIRDFEKMNNFMKAKVIGATHVRIRKAYTTESIVREITHKLYWDKWVILSWNPNEGGI